MATWSMMNRVSGWRSKKGVDFNVLSKGPWALAPDLSDLGYAAGAGVEGLYFRDYPDPAAPGQQVDLTFIGGLPE